MELEIAYIDIRPRPGCLTLNPKNSKSNIQMLIAKGMNWPYLPNIFYDTKEKNNISN